MHDASIEHLTNVDPVLARVIARVGPCRLTPRAEGTHFDALVRSIIYQQLSGKAAATIHSRVEGLYGDRSPTAAELLATPDESLRAARLSRQKLSYLKDLAAKVENGAITLDDTAIQALSDSEIIDRLVQVKGIGRWTVHMFLLFRLGRSDVLPELDLGVQNAIRLAYRLRRQPTPKDVRRIGARWAPHSSVASWYLWRSLEVREPDEPTPSAARRPSAAKAPAKKKSKAGATAATKRSTTKKRAAKKRATAKRGATSARQKSGRSKARSSKARPSKARRSKARRPRSRLAK
jgi:3-methyladenine DNA glycosylase/8-oxoguanine DNA glycosylase